MTIMPTSRMAASAGPRSRLQGARILVAEDNALTSEMLRDHLQSVGYSVDCVSDGNQAIELGGSGAFQLLLLDVHMPMYDGVEVLKLLRQRLLLNPIKVIALTGDYLATLRTELSRIGVEGYLTKPVELAQLTEEVARVLGTHRRPQYTATRR
jgi:CheY-like chemotaxis protein